MNRDLGPELQVCPSSKKLNLLLVVVLILILSGVSLTLYAALTQASAMHGVARIAAFFVVPLGFLGFGVLSKYLWDLLGLRVAVHKQGLSVRTRTETQSFNWSDVVSLREALTERKIKGTPAQMVREYNLELSDGSKVTIPFGLENVTAVGEALRDSILPAIGRKAAAAIERGQVVKFDDWTISAKMVRTPAGGELLWKQAGEAKVEQGKLRVTKRDGSLWQEKSYEDFPNAPVFVGLFESLRNNRGQKVRQAPPGRY